MKKRVWIFYGENVLELSDWPAANGLTTETYGCCLMQGSRVPTWARVYPSALMHWETIEIEFVPKEYRLKHLLLGG